MGWWTEQKQSFVRLVRRPTDEMTKAQRSLRFAVDLTRHCAKQLALNRAGQMAAALTYRTLFSLIPVVVLALLMFRAFVGFETARDSLQGTVYEFLGWSSVALHEPTQVQEGAVDPENVRASGDGASSDESAQARADQSIEDFVDKAWNKVSFGSIGIVGLLLLIWAALALMVTVEQCFNRVYGCPTGRAWHYRIAIYWAVITLGPVLLFMSLYMAGNALEWTARHVPWLASGEGASQGFWFKTMTALGASWLLLFLTYLLMPNTRVHLRPAAAGSLVAAVLWETGKWGFHLYVTRVVSYSALYASLGMVPLFLFWVYLTWLIVLFGLQVAYTLQAMKGRKFEMEDLLRRQQQQQMISDPRRLIRMMAAVGDGFAHGRPVGRDELARRLIMSPQSVADIGRLLEDEGLLHHVEGSRRHDGGYSLAIPPQQITIARLLDLGDTADNGDEGPGQAPGGGLLKSLQIAQRNAAGGMTLATVLGQDAS